MASRYCEIEQSIWYVCCDNDDNAEEEDDGNNDNLAITELGYFVR